MVSPYAAAVTAQATRQEQRQAIRLQGTRPKVMARQGGTPKHREATRHTAALPRATVPLTAVHPATATRSPLKVNAHMNHEMRYLRYRL